MTTLDITLIVVVALAGGLGGTLVGVAATARAAGAASGRPRRWVGPALVAGLGCGIVVAAAGAWGLASERSVLTSAFLLAAGGWLSVTAVRVLRRAGP